ncbi:hypothetical protein A2160_03445 [Candidatus Beckwithbacteria bacterium RBG_13_42_9]|uniref:Uncharacterized protein n=1 Tax=Candidatus Beckwithbacteria bacterium RBG_13_42_9 TaxID=1797457 RepID=A0A1F5E8J0_9BACT|nr:MAG: hypothetical protein A2160_03445 [Candidatus Beckwithbacteria bacterium RBG_13_42_9]
MVSAVFISSKEVRILSPDQPPVRARWEEHYVTVVADSNQLAVKMLGEKDLVLPVGYSSEPNILFLDKWAIFPVSDQTAALVAGNPPPLAVRILLGGLAVL